MQSEAAALELIQGSPVDALVVFGAVPEGQQQQQQQQQQPQPREEERDGFGTQLPPELLSYVIRTNRTDLPPPGLLRDLFDVSPGDMPLPGNLLWCVAAAMAGL